MLRPGRRLRRGAAAVTLVLLAGCTLLDPAPSPGVVSLERGPVLADEPLRLTVSELRAGARVTVAVRGAGQQEPVTAEFVADTAGTVDLGVDEPVAGSSYRQPSGYGLLWQLVLGGGVGRLEVSVSVDGEVIDEVTQDRVLAAEDVRSRRLWPSLDGLSGRYYFPADATGRRPGVVVFGGSEGGLRTTPVAQLLASRGYPTLALAYFDHPGLPDRLRGIPIEYFARALTWLGRQPGVDPDRVVPYGTSRGSEAALLVASLQPDLAAGAVAFAPNGVAIGDPVDGSRPAWTWRDRPVPWAETLRQWWVDPGNAVIDVWDIDGPILLVCGAADQVWSSCSQTEDIVNELETHGAATPTVLAFDDVGHEIGFALPGAGGAGAGVAGEDLEATGLARAEGWQTVLDYLHDL